MGRTTAKKDKLQGIVHREKSRQAKGLKKEKLGEKKRKGQTIFKKRKGEASGEKTKKKRAATLPGWRKHEKDIWEGEKKRMETVPRR